MAKRYTNQQVVEELRSELRGRIDELGAKVETDIRLRSGNKPVPAGKVQTAIRGLRRQAPATLGWKQARGLLDNQEYTGPIHNLMEIAKAIDVESHFARAVDRQVELTMKQGWRLKGRDPRRVRYITRRINEIMLISETTFGQLIEDTVRDLFTHANHNWVLKRDKLRSTGGPIRLHKRRVDPIAGVYAADPVCMSVKQTKSGNIDRWKLSKRNTSIFGASKSDRERTYPARDVIHFFINRKTGFLFGTPYVVPVLDDMRLLRRLEELTDIIAHKHAFPLMVVTVGTEKQPADEVMVDGVMVPEVNIAQSQVEQLDFEGGLVVPERYAIQLIGAEGKAIDLKPYLEHMERRVLGGLRLSEIDLGRGDSSNRNTAQSITQTLEDACSRVQRILEEIITWRFLFPLLMEGNFDVDLGDPDESMVFFDFPPINREEQRAQENHAMGLYQGQLCTEDECRVEMGRKPLSEPDRAGLHLKRVDEPQSKMETEAKQTVEKTKASVKSKTQPTNQTGTKATKPRQNKDKVRRYAASYVEQVDFHFKEACNQFIDGIDLSPGKDPNIGDRWKDRRPRGMAAQGTRTGYQAARLAHYTRDAETWMTMDARTYLTPIISMGFEEAVGAMDVQRNYVPKDDLDEFFRLSVRDSLKSHLRSAGGIFRLRGVDRRSPDHVRVLSGLEVHGSALLDAARRQARVAYLFGFLHGATLLGADRVNVLPEGSGTQTCSSCAPRTVSVGDGAEDLVCFRPSCRVEYSVAREPSIDVPVS
jgi:hypothetical protein